MKIKHLLIGMLAMAASVACKQEEPVVEPVLEVNKTAVALAATAGESTFNVTANNAWTASADADWVSLDPASGVASKDAVTVKVTAEDNTATEARVATVTVKSGEIARTIKVNQAAAEATGDDPVVDETKWGMMGCFVDNLWSKDVPMAKEGEWIVAKGAQFTELTFKIRGNESWADATNIGVAPGSERGVVNGKVAVVTAEYSKANLGGDAADIKLNGEAGTYDVYFSVENMEVYVMEQGYKPGEKEPQNPDPVEITYTVVGTLNNINWNNSAPEGLMAAEGQYLVAKNVPFVTAATLYGGADQFEFKIVETGTWTGYGRAEDVVTPVNGEIAVKMGGDNIMVTGAEGNYDVYFDKANLKVWVVTPGTKPGEVAPEQPEQPEQPAKSGWYIVGSFTGEGWGWDAAAGLQLDVLDENYYVYYGLELAEGAQWKFLNGTAWGAAEVGADRSSVDPNTIQAKGGSNIAVSAAGKYDIYLAADASKYYVMSEGKTPAEATEPGAAVITYSVSGTIKDAAWSNTYAPALLVEEGGYLVAKNLEFVWASALYGEYGADQIELKIFETGTYNGYGLAEAVTYAANAEISVVYGGASNIAVTTPEGTYDVYFDKENGKVWVMNAGLKPGETPAEPEPEYELDGKQWYYANMGVLVDLGLYEEGAMVVAVPLNDGSGFGAYMYGAYEIVKTDATSGKVVFTQYDPEWDEFMDPVDYPYSELSENLVMIGAEPLTGDPTPLPFVAVEEPYEIVFEEVGGADPVGPIENGQYWFFNGTKVMAPLAEGTTTGTLPAGNVINGASTEKNIFTLMYDPDMSYYTIMDSYGRFLGQTDETGNITVTDVLPTGEDYAYYLWCVETGYGEAVSIYNAAYYYDITYSSANNNWALVDGGYEYPETLPTLVKAENPVEEPVEPEGPKVVTVAEFNAATDNTIEYQVSGTISGIYQAYNASYDNISLYISDETGEMLAYRLSCAGITDPANTLTKGDLITVKGMRTLYNENPQMAQGGVIVEHTDVVVEAPAGSAELSFADKANRTVFTTSQQVWEQNGIKLINDKGASTSNVADYAAPARFYKSSKITVEYAGMTKIEFVCNNGSYATALKSSITTGTVSVNGSVVTVVLDAAADSYVISSLTGGQVRMDSLTVYAE
ncbi:MAG: SusF/SusE family outer membrane protein [Bacteroidales bacterium]|nr:SusF/SusE family outer membrane protein [Bacteroidales bacterium]